MRGPKKLPKKRILLAGGGEPRHKIEPVLNRAWFDVQQVDRATDAITASAETPLDLLVVALPLPDMDFEEFAGLIRGAFPATPVLALVAGEPLPTLPADLDDGLVRIESAEQSAKDLQNAAARLLGVAPRRSARIMIRMDVKVEGDVVRRMCQCQNLSASGMLIRSSYEFPVGSEVAVEINLPDETRPVRGMAMVVRHTDPAAEGLRGTGLRFLYFLEQGEERLSEFVERLEQEL